MKVSQPSFNIGTTAVTLQKRGFGYSSRRSSSSNDDRWSMHLVFLLLLQLQLLFVLLVPKTDDENFGFGVTTVMAFSLSMSSRTSTMSITSSSSTPPSLEHQRNYQLLKSSFVAPAKNKLTVSTEITIHEPLDATSLLLLTNNIQTLSERVRISQTNVMFVQTVPVKSTSSDDDDENHFRLDLTTLRTIVKEQQNAAGKFPGPVPIIYSCSKLLDTLRPLTKEDIQAIAETGVQGMILPITCSLSSSSTSDSDMELKINEHDLFQQLCSDLIQVGIQPVPEVIFLNSQQELDSIGQYQLLPTIHQENYLKKFITETICQAYPNPNEPPVAVVMSMQIHKNQINNDYDNDDDDDDMMMILPTIVSAKNAGEAPSSEELRRYLLPQVPEGVTDTIPIIGSIRALAGDNRLSLEVSTLKTLGYSGSYLRTDCIPGYDRIKYDYSIISQFWRACVQDLKSTKSKNFGGFRAKNNMDMSLSDKWVRYRKNILESGALGDPNDNGGADDLDTAGGDYQGFA